MKLFVSICMCVVLLSCSENPVGAVDAGKDDPEIKYFVGTAVNKEWPYRYTLVRDENGWSGEVELIIGGDALFFDKMEVISASNDKIRFAAVLGGIGKTVPAEWELSLSKAEGGLDGVLVLKSAEKEESVRLKFVEVERLPLHSTTFISMSRSWEAAFRVTLTWGSVIWVAGSS